jgi:hypothetical protein
MNALRALGPSPADATAAAGSGGLATVAAVGSAGAHAAVLLARMPPGERWRGWWRLVRGAAPFAGTPGLRLIKLLGSGRAGGFGLAPSGSHQGLFAIFDDAVSARRFLHEHSLLKAWQSHADESWQALLVAYASRGHWSGVAMGTLGVAPANGPIVALTRASIRPQRALQFWRRSPPAEAALVSAPGCLLAAGLGEAPLLRQATLTVWQSAAAMDRYARSGAHLEAIRSAYGQGHFSESMFVRLQPLWAEGRWRGQALAIAAAGAPP